MVTLIGRSDSGKSTLLRTINGLESVDQGELRVDGVALHDGKGDLRALHQKVGMVFQQFNLFPLSAGGKRDLPGRRRGAPVGPAGMNSSGLKTQGLKALKVEPLTAEAFAPFGEVIEAAGNPLLINNGNTERFDDLARISPGADGRAIVSIFRGQPRQLPFVVQMLERHPLGSQAFMPLNNRPYLVVVAPPGRLPALGAVRAFLARGDQGVNYAPGTWHHPLLALSAVSDFLVIDRAGPGCNCDEIVLDEVGKIEGLPGA